jgi:hypothetical protein
MYVIAMQFVDLLRNLVKQAVLDALTAYIRNISQADLQKVFANKIKRVQACLDARGHHFQQPFVSAQRLSGRNV